MSTSKSSLNNPPNVNISPHCHLDPVSYVKGDHLLTLEGSVLVHPRSKLFTDAGPITILEGSIVSEKCTIGSLSGSDSAMPNRGLQVSQSSKSVVLAGDDTTSSSSIPEQPHTQSGLPITIGKNVYVHPNVNIQPPSTIGDFVLLEPGITIMPNCNIGAHSKICAGVSLPTGTVVPSWTVVYGIDGRMRRKRHKDISEDARLEGVGRERVAAINLLRANATLNKLASSGSTSSTRDKRHSVLLGEGSKTRE